MYKDNLMIFYLNNLLSDQYPYSTLAAIQITS